MDSPTQRMITIGKATIGLIGLDTALNKSLSKELTEDQATVYIYEKISKKNYIPSGRENDYKDGLRKEYRRLTGVDDQESGHLKIRILGSGCISCNAINTMVIEVLNSAGIAADIEHIIDPDEIGRLGVLATPAVLINNVIKSTGIHPTLAQLETWIRESTEEKK